MPHFNNDSLTLHTFTLIDMFIKCDTGTVHWKLLRVNRTDILINMHRFWPVLAFYWSTLTHKWQDIFYFRQTLWFNATPNLNDWGLVVSNVVRDLINEVCCLMTPSHYSHQCCIIHNEPPWTRVNTEHESMLLTHPQPTNPPTPTHHRTHPPPPPMAKPLPESILTCCQMGQ